MGRIHSTEIDDLTADADGTSALFVMTGGARAWRLLELTIFQVGTTTLTMEEVIIERGDTASGGTSQSVYSYNISDVATTGVYSNATAITEATTITWQARRGWNMLQEFVWLPTPEIQLPVEVGDDVQVILGSSTAHTGIGVNVVWEEY